MSAMSLRLPNSLHAAAKELAEREGISVNQLVASALAEKLSALMTLEVLEKRARRGSRTKFLAALARVPDVPPVPGDELPSRRAAPATKRRKPPARRKATGQARARAK